MRPIIWMIPFAVAGTFMAAYADEAPATAGEKKTETVAALPQKDVFTRRRILETRIKKADTFLNAVLTPEDLNRKKQADQDFKQHEKDTLNQEQRDMKAALKTAKRSVPTEAMVKDQNEAAVTRLTDREAKLLEMLSKRQREVFDKAEKALAPTEFDQYVNATKGLNMAENELFLDKVIAAKSKADATPEATPSAPTPSAEPVKEPAKP